MGYSLAAFMQMHERRKAIDILYRDLVERKYQNRGLSRNQWTVVEVVVDCLRPVARIISQQQTRLSNYWLLTDSTMSMIKLHNSFSEPAYPSTGVVDTLGDCSDTFREEILILVERMKKRIVDTIRPAIAPLLEFIPEQGHITISLMLDPR